MTTKSVERERERERERENVCIKFIIAEIANFWKTKAWPYIVVRRVPGRTKYHVTGQFASQCVFKRADCCVSE